MRSDVQSSNHEHSATWQFHYWRGKTGGRYLHRVYSLADCPEMPPVNFVLVNRAADNTCSSVAVGQTTHQYGPANLAKLRHEAALRGANEIHIHMVADTRADRDRVEQDVRAGQFDFLIRDLKSGAANAA